ncbi:MAG: hypothetical protein ABR577_08140 [Pyrinomonadaceae bacterium]
MSVQITPNAEFDVYSRQNGWELVNQAAEHSNDWAGDLPQSGTYVISVRSTGGTTSYTLDVSIE